VKLRAYVTLTIHEFNTDAFARAAQYISRAFCLRRGTQSRVAQTESAVAQSRVVIANADALLASNAMQLVGYGPLTVQGRQLRKTADSSTGHYPDGRGVFLDLANPPRVPSLLHKLNLSYRQLDLPLSRLSSRS
jgi:hypothetical protein